MQLNENRTSKTRLMASGGWFAIYTRHQHEKATARILANKGFRVFLPLYEKRNQWKDRTKQLSLPLFPCYLFIDGDKERRLDIVTTPGFRSFVGVGGQPSAIPEAEIDAVRRVLSSGSHIEPCSFLKCGDKVRICSGPLQDLEGILVRKKNSFRLIISVELLQKSLSVEVDACLVERVAHRVALPRTLKWAATGAAAV